MTAVSSGILQAFRWSQETVSDLDPTLSLKNAGYAPGPGKDQCRGGTAEAGSLLAGGACSGRLAAIRRAAAAALRGLGSEGVGNGLARAGIPQQVCMSAMEAAVLWSAVAMWLRREAVEE